MPGSIFQIKTIRPPPKEMDLDIQIEFPAGWPGGLSGQQCKVFVYDDESQTYTHASSVGTLALYVDSAQALWAELEMFADEDGKPLLTGPPVIRNYEVVVRRYTAHVRSVKSVASYREGWDARGKQEAPK